MWIPKEEFKGYEKKLRNSKSDLVHYDFAMLFPATDKGEHSYFEQNGKKHSLYLSADNKILVVGTSIKKVLDRDISALISNHQVPKEILIEKERGSKLAEILESYYENGLHNYFYKFLKIIGKLEPIEGFGNVNEMLHILTLQHRNEEGGYINTNHYSEISSLLSRTF